MSPDYPMWEVVSKRTGQVWLRTRNPHYIDDWITRDNFEMRPVILGPPSLADALKACEAVAARFQGEADENRAKGFRPISPLLQKSGADECVRAIRAMISRMETPNAQ